VFAFTMMLGRGPVALSGVLVVLCRLIMGFPRHIHFS
jgi:hypothetical protein